MDKKILIGGGAAVLLSLGTLIGGVATGIAGAQSSQPAQTSPRQAPNQGAEGPEAADGPDTPVSLPAGSVSQAAAKQAAAAYIQQTAPYNTQGLSATRVQVDDENGVAVYTVTFWGAASQAAEVTVSPQGQVLKAEADNEGQETSGVDPSSPNDPADSVAPQNQTAQ